MVATTTMPVFEGDQPPMFTCLSCHAAFASAEDQRAHYRSDLHRYNMKRRVAELPPVSAVVFNEKILQRRAALQGSTADDSASTASTSRAGRCEACSKSFSSENAYRDHLASKKHKENVEKTAKRSTDSAPAQSPSLPTAGKDLGPLVFRIPDLTSSASSASTPLADVSDLKAALPISDSVPAAASAKSKPAQAEPPASVDASGNPTSQKKPKTDLVVSEDASQAEIEAAIDARVSSSKRVDPSKSCIFCSRTNFKSLADSLAHMTLAHGFFIPEEDYLIDLAGLVQYLSDKVHVGHLCLHCNGRGRGFADAHAVRKHMIDKFHCKIAYEDEEDRLELSDFYDFTSSYPTPEWEDVDGEDDESGEDVVEEGEEDEADDAVAPSNGIRYGDSELELVLPSGARLGHRSLRRYYNQTLWQTPAGHAQANNGRALAHRLIANRAHEGDGTLVQNRGGDGTTVRARNRGEAREATRHTREFRDVVKREQFKTRVMYTNNNQKHFRDPLLQ